jgi:hypothetical protein
MILKMIFIDKIIEIIEIIVYGSQRVIVLTAFTNM